MQEFLTLALSAVSPWQGLQLMIAVWEGAEHTLCNLTNMILLKPQSSMCLKPDQLYIFTVTPAHPFLAPLFLREVPTCVPQYVPRHTFLITAGLSPQLIHSLVV